MIKLTRYRCYGRTGAGRRKIFWNFLGAHPIAEEYAAITRRLL